MEDVITRQIVESLLTLADRRPLEKITITELLQAAGVSRTAFNNRFEDLNMLICSIWESRVLRNSWDALDSSMDDYRLGCLLSCKRYMKYKKFMRQACRMTGQNCLRDYMVAASVRFEKAHLPKEKVERLTKEQVDFLAHYHAHAVNALIVEWLEDNCRRDPEVFADMITRTRFSVMETMF